MMDRESSSSHGRAGAAAVLAFCALLLIVVISLISCGRRADPVLVPEYEEDPRPEVKDEQKGKKGTAMEEEAPDTEEKELVPPEAPSGLKGIFTGKSVILTWQEVLRPGAGIYRIYRSSGDGYVLAGESAAPAYSDRDVKPGMKYHYRVTAVTAQESPPSREVVISTETEP